MLIYRSVQTEEQARRKFLSAARIFFRESHCDTWKRQKNNFKTINIKENNYEKKRKSWRTDTSMRRCFCQGYQLRWQGFQEHAKQVILRVCWNKKMKFFLLIRQKKGLVRAELHLSSALWEQSGTAYVSSAVFDNSYGLRFHFFMYRTSNGTCKQPRWLSHAFCASEDAHAQEQKDLKRKQEAELKELQAKHAAEMKELQKKQRIKSQTLWRALGGAKGSRSENGAVGLGRWPAGRRMSAVGRLLCKARGRQKFSGPARSFSLRGAWGIVISPPETR